MRKYFENIVVLIIFSSLPISLLNAADDNEKGSTESTEAPELYSAHQEDTVEKPRFPVKDKDNYPFSNSGSNSPLYLNPPSNIESDIIFNPETGEYEFSEKIGELHFRPPSSMSLEEYREYEMEKSKSDYWQQRAKGESLESRASFIPQISFGGAAFDKVFGSNTINITPQGSAELIFGFNMSRIDNPTISEKLRKTPSFTFEEKIQMNVTGSIGDKMELGINYNTEATFDFENKTKLEYSGKEDEIIKKIEAGNVTLPLSGSLITGSQSLFGLKTEMQFGKLTVTNVFSQQKGETSVIEMEGGAQTNSYEVPVIDYEANKHFFLSHYFKDKYDRALENLPVINSDITITKIEVWVTNKSGNFENARNILALMDLAETGDNIYNDAFSPVMGERYPNNNANNEYKEITDLGNVREIKDVTKALNNYGGSVLAQGRDYEKIENARLLTPREYNLNSRLGYISLNSALNADEVLAVAYEYTANGKTYKVGELTTDGVSSPQLLMVKLIKGTNLSPKFPTWELMMKNVYAIGAYQVNKDDFSLEILYQDDQTGTALNYIKEGKIKNEILLKVLSLDRLNSQGDPKPDGVFDFLNGYTINSSNGRVIFPVREPFGAYLRDKITGEGADYDPGLEKVAEKYVYDELYDSTQTIARQIAEKNKFLLAGEYQSSQSNEIMLNAMNIPQGSVNVTAGGIQLEENVDYTVDYTLGRVKIINQGLLESGTPVKISLESHSLFNIQTKTMIGTHLDYRVSDDFNLGGTVLRLTERPLTKKVNIGDEPISNTIWGLTGSYRTESQFLTTMIDKLPFLETKETSTITVDGEFAQLIPGQSKAISKKGISYIDDFEGSETSIDMKSFHTWKLASAPQGQDKLIPEANLNFYDVAYGYNRAKLAWYVIDPLFLRNNTLTPPHMKNNPELQGSHYVREVKEKEIFPEKDKPRDQPANITVLNLAYYPDEKGPYNYDLAPTQLDDGTPISDGIDQDGKLRNPKSRWAGVMRDIQTNDFEAANVEFIEFWLMDPFVENPDHDGGKLYFNLGDVSEDVLKDSRKSFENGLPTSDSAINVDETVWGRVPTQQSYVNAFDSDPTTRIYQDIGLDGLDDEQEAENFIGYLDSIRALYGEDSRAYQDALEDPSNDNYHYYRGSNYDDEELTILERYKKYNGMDGNSPTDDQSPESYPTTGTIQPDVEDINRDNTLSESENYYQYSIDLNPDQLRVGSNYITNVIESGEKDNEGRTVKWYQFKIPVKNPDQVIGQIQGFKSIRFMRVFLTEWEEQVVLRFAKLDLVRSEWRKYELPFNEANEDISTQDPEAKFDVLSVNIEENATKEPVSYVLPPGIDRVIDPTNPQLQQLNEQSIVLRVNDLADGDARAAFKTINLDIRQYRNLEMEVHAEAIQGIPLGDKEVTAFIRLGTDYKNNYYEYEIPLVLTPPGDYYRNGNYTEDDRQQVWPEENRFDINLEIFQRAKQARNDAIRQIGSQINYTTVFPFPDGDNIVSVVGNPNLSNVKVIMIGIRNPGNNGSVEFNDGLPKSAEIWMNELRLTNFRDKGGWAANARVQARLADFGILTLAGSTSKPGFGSIEKKVNERSKEELLQYDVSTNLELGKFFPEKAQVTIPMYVGVSETVINPQYNPLDKDIPLKAALDNAESDSARRSIKRLAQDRTTRKSINFTNVKINKTEGKPKLWSISNFAASYSYNEIEASNINTEYDLEFNHRGALTYVYNARPKNITPLSKVKALNNPYLRLIKDFNFYYLPSRVSIRTDVNRHYNEIKTRNIDNPNLLIDATADRDFLWNRYYDIKFDLTRSLKIDYSATNMARIDETDFYLRDQKDSTELYREWRDSLFTNIKNLGRNTSFNHRIDAQYSLPINKIPIVNWVSLSARYSGTYEWTAGPQLVDNDLGNVIKNTNSIQFNNNNNLINLYNKVGFLKRINQKYRQGRRPRQQKKEFKTVTYEEEEVNLYGNRSKSIEHRLKTENISVRVIDAQGEEIEVETRIINENKIRITSGADHDDVKVVVEGEVEDKENPIIFIAENALRMMMGVKNLSVSYSQNHGTMLPGYTPEVKYFGLIRDGQEFAPGVPFVLGWQYENFDEYMRETVFRRNWLTTDTLLNTPYSLTSSENINIRSTIEPLNGLRIDLTGNWSKSWNFEEFYTYNHDVNDYQFLNDSRIETGNLSMSYITWGTAFEKLEAENSFQSESFETFKQSRMTIALRLLDRHRRQREPNSPPYNNDPESEFYNPDPSIPDSLGFPTGFGPTSQQVLIPAFLAAYGKQDPNKISLDPFPSYLNLLPNWRITYDGLSKIDFVKKYLRSVNLSHTYRSTYTIGSFVTNSFYEENEVDGISYIRDIQDNFIANYEINSVSISEQFSPLISVDMTWKNSLTTRFEIKKSRNLTLSMANNQLTEMKSDEIVVGAGYRFDEVEIFINQRTFKSDLNVRADFSIRDNINALRTLALEKKNELNEPTSGQRILTIKGTADYVLSDRFNLRFFFDRVINTPYITTSYPTANTNVGFSVTFTLSQ